jgi:hypothetical protein
LVARSLILPAPITKIVFPARLPKNFFASTTAA